MRCQQQKKAFEAIQLLVALTFQRGTKKRTCLDISSRQWWFFSILWDEIAQKSGRQWNKKKITQFLTLYYTSGKEMYHLSQKHPYKLMRWTIRNILQSFRQTTQEFMPEYRTPHSQKICRKCNLPIINLGFNYTWHCEKSNCAVQNSSREVQCRSVCQGIPKYLWNPKVFTVYIKARQNSWDIWYHGFWDVAPCSLVELPIFRRNLMPTSPGSTPLHSISVWFMLIVSSLLHLRLPTGLIQSGPDLISHTYYHR